MQHLSLYNYDLFRELCDHCRRERFHFVPIGAAPAAGKCSACGSDSRVADLSDTSIRRLVTTPDGEVVIVPVIAR